MPVSYGTANQAVTITNWNSLAAAARGASSNVDNTTNLYHAASLLVTLKTSATTPTAGDYVEVWLEGSVDGGTTFGTDQGVMLGTLAQPTAGSTVFSMAVETDSALAVLPATWRITIVNRGAQTLFASGNALAYRGKKAA